MSDSVPLLKSLEGHFDKLLVELPYELGKRVQRHFPMPWDEMEPDQRRSMAAQWDCPDGPAAELRKQSLLRQFGVAEPEQLTPADAVKRKATLLRKITEVIANPALPDVTRESLLAGLRAKHQDLEERLARGDYHEINGKGHLARPPGHLDHDQALQARADLIAHEQMAATKRPITKGKVANILAKELGMDASTVERRIRKQW